MYHKDLAGGKRYKMTFAKQMANIGSEIFRVHQAKTRYPERFNNALERALELFDLTITNPNLSKSKRKELCRAREVFCDFSVGDNQYQTDIFSFQRYFDDFALIK